jgi:hypothetical protein
MSFRLVLRDETTSPSACFRELFFNVREELGHGHIETPSDSEHGLNGQIALTSFYAAHVGSVQAAVVGKGFLGEAFLQPHFSDSRSQSFLEVCHLSQSENRPTKGLQPSCGQPSYSV